jgi:hypothetical protein
MVLYEIWTGRQPFAEQQDSPSLRASIANGSLRPIMYDVDAVLDPVGFEIGEIVKLLWNNDPHVRLSAKAVATRLRRLLARPPSNGSNTPRSDLVTVIDDAPTPLVI